MFDHESVINSLAVIIVFSSAVTVKVIDAFLQPWTKHNATCILYGIPIRHVLLCSVRTDVFCNLLIFFFYYYSRYTYLLSMNLLIYRTTPLSLNVFINTQFFNLRRELNNPAFDSSSSSIV